MKPVSPLVADNSPGGAVLPHQNEEREEEEEPLKKKQKTEHLEDPNHKDLVVVQPEEKGQCHPPSGPDGGHKVASSVGAVGGDGRGPMDDHESMDTRPILQRDDKEEDKEDQEPSTEEGQTQQPCAHPPWTIPQQEEDSKIILDGRAENKEKEEEEEMMMLDG